jgi:2-dehydro-3-deoxy-D-arabinonate dehydratase
MRLVKFRSKPASAPQVGVIWEDQIRPIEGIQRIGDLLNGLDAEDRILQAVEASTTLLPLASVSLLAPIDSHEIWGAGVTYERSKVARQEESVDGGSFYDQVYRADRPELFFKATPSRVVGPDAPIRVRSDSTWSVPEPELALVLSPDLRLVGFTIGNDVSARDIEGRNPLYLPQAKVYDGCCALGPAILRPSPTPGEDEFGIQLEIERDGVIAFSGLTTTARMARRFTDLIDWLGRDNVFPDGVVLLTGTGIVPPDEFHLTAGDVVRIRIEPIGTLSNPVVQGAQ